MTTPKLQYLYTCQHCGTETRQIRRGDDNTPPGWMSFILLGGREWHHSTFRDKGLVCSKACLLALVPKLASVFFPEPTGD